MPTFDLNGWLLRIGAAALLLGVGFTKFQAESYWVHLFAQIGLGDWFRYVTGTLQVVAGLLFLVPKLAIAAGLLAGATMAGAAAVHLFVLDTGVGGAVVPLAVLAFIGAVAARRPE